MSNLSKAYLACGCFWGVQYQFERLHGVGQTTVGYMGGAAADANYKAICAGNTDHKEVIEIIYDSNQVRYIDILHFFFEIHDYTQTDGQGGDIGDQYLSTIYYQDPKERALAQDTIDYLSIVSKRPVATLLTPATEFYPAEEYHQDYYAKNGQLPYCHTHRPLTWT